MLGSCLEYLDYSWIIWMAGNSIMLIDDFNLKGDFSAGLNGDFVESQAFAYLAIRSYLKKNITFPNTTGVSKPCSGGLVYKAKQ